MAPAARGPTVFADGVGGDDLSDTPTSNDQTEFDAFYAETARGLRSYLRHLVRDPARAQDLFQESYLRFINARLPADMTPGHRKNYLYRIATNLANDLRAARTMEALPEPDALGALPEDAGRAYDVRQALGRLKPKERTLLWLAYVECFSHEEIAKVARARPASIRPMLSRARTRLAGILTRRGYRPDKGERS